MSNVVRLFDRVPVDPILRKGDTIKIVDICDLDPEICSDDGFETPPEEVYAIVTEILMVFPDTHEFAPGQATYINAAIPFDDVWHEVESVPIEKIRRIIGEEYKSMKGYTKH